MKGLRALLTALAVVLLFITANAATQQQQSNATPNGFVLEITRAENATPVYQPVGNKAWHAFFRRIPSWQPPAGALPVLAVNVVSYMEGDGVRIKISIFEGCPVSR